jgi:hypothetical protein
MKNIYRIHTIQRMFEREVSTADVRSVLENGHTIETYADKDYPARLVLGRSGRRTLHVVIAENSADGENIVVTAYQPERAHWEAGFERRKTT